ncbi:hypothetical protein JL720_3608 [Aureococcus anophagefferens]|nr:hypothetical protein JL720_3608 [Aureococcus anophagefferens]
MPAPARVAAPGNGTGFGVLRVLDGGYHTLETAGTPWQRGWAHGYLLAAQILDFFEFFVLEDRVRGAPAAIKSRYPAIRDALERRIALSPTAERKVRGMLAGMAASGANLSTSVGNFGYGDLLAINNYNDFSRILELDGRPARHEREDSCTQFVFFGDLTGGEGTIAGRNMDGENDVRKVTVRSLVLFADAGAKKVVHAMWPGFVGASSAFNEDGTYLMENAGCSPALEPLAAGATVPSERDMILGLLQEPEAGLGLPRLPTPGAAFAAVEERWASNATGGACISGCILVFARPSLDLPGDAGWIIEGDLRGHAVRGPAQPNVEPFQREGVMASNHYWRYNTDPLDVRNNGSARCNGQAATFSSLWRYEAGKNRVEALLRDAAAARATPVDEAKMQTLLRTVSHGTTEHSIIFHPDDMRFSISKAALDAPANDAPDRTWTTFAFTDMFSS